MRQVGPTSIALARICAKSWGCTTLQIERIGLIRLLQMQPDARKVVLKPYSQPVSKRTSQIKRLKTQPS